MDRPSSFADGIGRMLGTLGIVLAVGGSVYLYQQHQQLQLRVGSLEEASPSTDGAADVTDQLTQRIDALAASDKAFQAKWDAQLSDEVVDFKTRTEGLLETERQAFDQQRKLIDARFASMKVNPADIDAAVNQKIDTLRKVVLAESQPVLRVAQSVMKPSDGGDAVVMVVANESDSEVGVDFVAFRPKPKGQFEIDAAEDMEADWVLRFLPEENTATTAGRHHHYERSYDLAKRWLPAKQNTSLVVQIENSKHRGWGLEGELVIQYDDGKRLTVPQARAVFVDNTLDPKDES